MTQTTKVFAGTATSPTTVSWFACDGSSGATGFRRIVSLVQASMKGSSAICSSVKASGRGATRFTSSRAPHRLGMAVQEVEQPGERVGGRVLAGDQGDEDVARDIAVVDLAARHVGGDDHRLEQVARAGAQLRIVAQPLARLGDEARDRRLHLADAALEAALRRQGK